MLSRRVTVVSSGASRTTSVVPTTQRSAYSRSIPARLSRPSGTSPARSKPRAGLVCRADVNWDAFRSNYEISSVSNPQRTAVKQYDFVVIGSGIAGLSYALKVAPYGSVAVITKDYAHEGCTQYAQGGVCAVLDAADSVDSHVQDTIIAGGHLNDRQ